MGEKFGERTPRPLDEHNGEKGRFFYYGPAVLTRGGGAVNDAATGITPLSPNPPKEGVGLAS